MSIEAIISTFQPRREFYTDERCYIMETHNRLEDEDCSIVRARVTPGVTTKLHTLRGIDERYVILQGEGIVEVGGGEPTAVRPIDVVVIPAGISQRITNVGTGDLIFLCVCTPRFRVESYLDLENQVDNPGR
jgi:mannose-6-phosphate isomerase-like protein (cupin superfamily)